MAGWHQLNGHEFEQRCVGIRAGGLDVRGESWV